MAVVGYEWRTPMNTGLPGMRYSWDEIKTLAVVDDNQLPYMSIPGQWGCVLSKGHRCVYCWRSRESVLSADAFEKLVPKLFNLGAVVQLPAEGEDDYSLLHYHRISVSAFVRGHATEYIRNSSKPS